jgi:hypothetical protein
LRATQAGGKLRIAAGGWRGSRCIARPVGPPVTKPVPPFLEKGLAGTPIRDLGLTIEGTPLESIIEEFRGELRAIGIHRVQPRFYLSTEWGVPMDTVAIAIPFYLADPRLTELHASRGGYVEGVDRPDILRYLRHEMGHVINYAYRLYADPRWIKLFGSITQPYEEEYRPAPFSRRYVRHLPGWYAQKHPDEDWAETFAVWMTPGADWRGEYADWPQALAKLTYCGEQVKTISELDPHVTADDLDGDVAHISQSLDDYYAAAGPDDDSLPIGLTAALRTLFPEARSADAAAAQRPASKLLQSIAPGLAANVFCWTGHFPERTHRLLRSLRKRADELGLVYAPASEHQIALAATVFVTSLATTYVRHGSYLGD